MAALIVRELRRLRVPVLMALGLLAATVVGWTGYRRLIDPDVHGSAMIFWFLLLPLLALGLGAHMFASERAHREVPFARSWPVSARQVGAAKALVALGLLAGIYGLVVYATAWVDPDVLRINAEAVEKGTAGVSPMVLHAAVCLLLLAAGMAASSVTATPLGALIMGVVSLGVVLAGMWAILEGIVGPLWGPLLGLHWATVRLTLVPTTVIALALSAVFLGASAAATVRHPPLEHGARMRTGAGWLGGLALAVIPPLLVAALVFGEGDRTDVTGAYIADAQDGAVLVWDPYIYAWSAEVWRLWWLPADGGEVRCLARWPSWPVDTAGPGEVVAWGARAGNENAVLWYADMSGGLRRLPVRSRAERALASPSGRLLCVPPYVLRIGKQIEPLDLRLPRIDRGPDREPGAIRPLRFAPDESEVYWTSADIGEEDALWVTDLRSGETRLVSGPPGGAENASPRVSPDARWVAWYASRDVGGEPPMNWAVIEELGGDARRAIQDAIPWTWSPDGQYIALSDSGDVEIVEVPSLETVRRIVARRVGVEGWGIYHDVWSPDGTRMMLIGWRTLRRDSALRDDVDNTREYSLWVANMNGSDLRQVAVRSRISDVHWISEDRLVFTGRGDEHVTVVDVESGEEHVMLEMHPRNAHGHRGLSK